jgi:hypothetical protein
MGKWETALQRTPRLDYFGSSRPWATLDLNFGGCCHSGSLSAKEKGATPLKRSAPWDNRNHSLVLTALCAFAHLALCS